MRGGSKLQLSEGGFDQAGGDFPATSLFDGALPGQLCLIEGEAGQRAQLGFVVRLQGLGAIRDAMENLGRL